MTASPQLWKDAVPVEFHVSYSDNSQWRDRFSSQAWTARQKNYAVGWHSSLDSPNIALHRWLADERRSAAVKPRLRSVRAAG